MLAQAGTRALGALVNKHKHVGLGYHTYTKLYNACVLPIIMYCAGVWGYKQFTKLTTVQNKAMRAFLSVNTFTSNACVSGDMAWNDCMVLRKIQMLKFWNRVIKVSNSILL
jgi:hypothetical protein